MHNYVKIDNEPGLVRDMSSHAVVLNAPEKIADYTARRNAAKNRAEELAEQRQEIESIKNDVHEIKSMLQALLQR
jgi:hypothetical protein